MNYRVLYRMILFIVSFWILSGCTKSKTIGNVKEKTIEETTTGRKMDAFTYLKKCMNGYFTSEKQSHDDSAFFDIRLRMEPIWPEQQDVYYLFVEQAMSTAQDKPYRVRIYKVVKENETDFTSYIYKLKDQSRFIGKKGTDEVFKTLTPDSLQMLDGCEVKLKFDENKWEFTGSTGNNTCPSDRNGASYTTSKVTINDQRMISWDQGWNKEGLQVWGAVKGGYIFEKQQ
jgi:CpeT protein